MHTLHRPCRSNQNSILIYISKSDQADYSRGYTVLRAQQDDRFKIITYNKRIVELIMAVTKNPRFLPTAERI